MKADNYYMDSQKQIQALRKQIQDIKDKYAEQAKLECKPLYEEIRHLQGVGRRPLLDSRKDLCIDFMHELLNWKDADFSTSKENIHEQKFGTFNNIQRLRYVARSKKSGRFDYESPSAEVMLYFNYTTNEYKASLKIGMHGLAKVCSSTKKFKTAQEAVDNWHKVVQDSCSRYLKRIGLI